MQKPLSADRPGRHVTWTASVSGHVIKQNAIVELTLTRLHSCFLARLATRVVQTANVVGEAFFFSHILLPQVLS